MTRKRITTIVAVAATAALGAALAGCTTDDGGGEDGLVELKVATTVVGPTYWPFYYTPEILGYYEEEGLDVEVVPINTGVTQSLLAGQIDVGGAGFDYVQQGGNVTGLNWYLMTDRHLFAPIVLDSSPIQEIADLAGTRIGINEPNDSFDADFVLASNGLELGDYELVPIGEAAPAAQAMVRGEIDAMLIPATTSFLRAGDAIDEELRILDTPSSGEFYNTGLMATEEWLEENRETAIAFGRAIAKGIIWMNENPEATAEMIMETQPDAAPDLETAIRQVNRAVEWNSTIYESRGQIDGSILQAEIEALVQVGLIDESYDAETLYDGSFATEIWDFDVDAVIAEAREGNWQD